MADIRINALATTAASTASDDYIAIDGSANGTRKLDAYSPTFGGNLTVNGSINAVGQSVIVSPSSGTAKGRINSDPFRADVIQVGSNWTGGTQDDATKPSWYWFFDSRVAGDAATLFRVPAGGSTTSALAISSTAATLAGNLTVSGTGLSSVAGGLKAQSVEAVGTPASYNSTGGIITAGYAGSPYAWIKAYSDAGGTEKALTIQPASGVVLLGTTTNSGNGKLQLATHTTSAGGIGFGTETSLYRYGGGIIGLDHIGGSVPGLNLLANGTRIISIYGASNSLYLDTFNAAGAMYLRTGAQTTALTLDSSQRTILSGALRLNNAYTASAVVPTGYVTIQDSTGTTYKVCVLL